MSKVLLQVLQEWNWNFKKLNEQGNFPRSKRGKSIKFLGKFVGFANNYSWNVMEQVQKRNDVFIKRVMGSQKGETFER